MMTTTCAVTMYHYDEEKEIWERDVFPKCHLYYIRGAAADKGFKRQNNGIIRIPINFEINIKIGDRLFKGNLNADKPPAEGCMTVTGYKDNRRGVNPHWRINVI